MVEEEEEVDVQNYGKKLTPEAKMQPEEPISEPVEIIEIIDRGELQKHPDLFRPKVTPYHHSAPRRPAGTPEPFVYICKDPAKCPPPHHGPPRIPYGPPPGLHICRDPSNCPPHSNRYGPPPPRPYRIRPRPVKTEDTAPRYTAETPSTKTVQNQTTTCQDRGYSS